MRAGVISIFIFLFSLQVGWSQTDKNIPVFNRLLILNAKNELMVVKIKGAGFWVTPGLYQNAEQSIKQGLDSLAETYGLKIQQPKLRGIFLLKRDIKETQSASIRNVFSAQVENGGIKKPEGIEEVFWLPLDKALEKITFPHINAMIEPIMSTPDAIWSGTLLQFKKEELWQVKILEEFYTL